MHSGLSRGIGAGSGPRVVLCGSRAAKSWRGAASFVRLGILLVGVAGRSVEAAAQISPGPLARAHASLGGPLDCMKCHAKDEKGLDQQCLACHREIAATIKARLGLHGKGRLEGCARCHPDHAGEDFELIAWEEGSEERFDHSKTTFELKGRHKELECRDCHNAEHSVSAIASLSPRKDRSRGFVGLEKACASCHEDPHRGVLGESCATCHGENKWIPASGFHHADTAYPLTGKHQETECDACHRAERLSLPVAADGRREALWKPLPHGECSDCHADPHRERLGPQCSTCHSTASFRETDRERFDHDKTRYPLRGRHRALECAQCHDEKKAWGAKPRFERCSDCHEEAHGKGAMLAGKPVDCGSCHSVDGFKPSTVTAAMHADFAYPLTGAHFRVACASCHPKRKGSAALGLGTAAVLMRPPYGDCTDCHSDPHRGRFGSGGDRPYDKQCLSCHGTQAFRPARFGIDEHALSLFPLEGAHRTVPCSDCHQELERSGAGRANAPAMDFRERFARCSDCHETPHGTQFDGRGDCSSCHSLEAFAPADGFDHAKLEAFPLTGAHAGVACAKCHPEREVAGGRREVVYRPIAHECQDCHGSAVPAAGGNAGAN